MNIKYFKGLIVSIPSALLLLLVFVGEATHNPSWFLLIFFGLISLPWNILIYIVLICLSFALHFIFNFFELTQLIELMAFDEGYGLFIWFFYVSFVLGGHINGTFIYNLINKDIH